MEFKLSCLFIFMNLFLVKGIITGDFIKNRECKNDITFKVYKSGSTSGHLSLESLGFEESCFINENCNWVYNIKEPKTKIKLTDYVIHVKVDLNDNENAALHTFCISEDIDLVQTQNSCEFLLCFKKDSAKSFIKVVNVNAVDICSEKKGKDKKDYEITVTSPEVYRNCIKTVTIDNTKGGSDEDKTKIEIKFSNVCNKSEHLNSLRKSYCNEILAGIKEKNKFSEEEILFVAKIAAAERYRECNLNANAVIITENKIPDQRYGCNFWESKPHSQNTDEQIPFKFTECGPLSDESVFSFITRILNVTLLIKRTCYIFDNQVNNTEQSNLGQRQSGIEKDQISKIWNIMNTEKCFNALNKLITLYCYQSFNCNFDEYSILRKIDFDNITVFDLNNLKYDTEFVSSLELQGLNLLETEISHKLAVEFETEQSGTSSGESETSSSTDSKLQKNKPVKPVSTAWSTTTKVLVGVTVGGIIISICSAAFYFLV